MKKYLWLLSAAVVIGALRVKVYYFAPIASAFSNGKPDFSQSEAIFGNDAGFATVYHRIYWHKFLLFQDVAFYQVH